MKQVMQINNKQLERVDHSHVPKSLLKAHYEQIKTRLRSLGAVQYDLWLPETNVLPLVIHANEHIKGIVYGKYKQNTSGNVIHGRGALVATNYRVLLVDHKPLFMKCDEIAYRVVSAISYSKVGPAGTVTLHTRMGDISVRTFNHQCAHSFVEAIEEGIESLQGVDYDYAS